jgi:RNase adaptor protein for sRNA GlmZ degradation
MNQHGYGGVGYFNINNLPNEIVYTEINFMAKDDILKEIKQAQDWDVKSYNNEIESLKSNITFLNKKINELRTGSKTMSLEQIKDMSIRDFKLWKKGKLNITIK